MIEFRAYADEKKYAYVLVRVAPSRRAMLTDIKESGFHSVRKREFALMGQCSGLAHYSKSGRLTGRFAIIWMNTVDLQSRATEIIAHEATHAAMRHATNRRADLSAMDGEEVLCYAVGKITRGIVNGCHKHGVFK